MDKYTPLSIIEHEISIVSDMGRAINVESLSVEEPLEIRLSQENEASQKSVQFTITMRTPGDDNDLIMGLLYCESIIEGPEDIRKILFIDRNVREVVLAKTCHFHIKDIKNRLLSTSSCGICGKSNLEAMAFESKRLAWASRKKIKSELLLKMPALMKSVQNQFVITGGVHAAALFTIGGELKLLKEDVGRHNAMDKLVGSALHIDVKDKLVLVSGRTSYELVQKTAMVGIAILASIGPASSMAVEIAISEGITLVGFLKSNRFNIYSHPERIIT